jgi:hypothetical protein
MAGLLVLALAGAWLWLAVVVGKRASSLTGSTVLAPIVFVIVTGGIAILPFVDQLVGQWQFERLCQSEGKVWVSPSATRVIAARDVSSFSEREGFVFPVSEQWVKYADVATGEVFYSVKAFHTPGGFVMRAGLNMGSSKACWPPKRTSKEHGLDLDAMINRGRQ